MKLEPCDMCKNNYSLMLANNSAKLGGGIYLKGASRMVLSYPVALLHK